MDTAYIESKWRERWNREKCFESDPKNKKAKRFVTAAFPYPNSPLHIGHGRTYTTADIYARYLRMEGFNVLFPMGFHVTGTPILAMAKRIGKKDAEVLSVFENVYDVDAKTAESLTEPEELVSFFSREVENGMKEMGYSIDWRRRFYSFDERFNKFIQWQFRKLKELGFLIQGDYPIAWCPVDGNALSAHDTKGDVDPDLEEVTVIEFKTGSGERLIVTTYRPETVYGVTNIWINPSAEYVRARYGGNDVILSKDAAEVLKYQMDLDMTSRISPSEIMRMEAINPINGSRLPVYPASFVSSDVGTGIVMSVPAHAPLDYLALRDIGKRDIDMPQVLKLEGHGNAPAKETVERMGVKDQDDPLTEAATKEVYAKEAHEGVMVAGKYAGEKAMDAKEKIARDLIDSSDAFNIYTIANGPVYCRCGAQAVVNILNDQWFIDYGIKDWKEKTKDCLAGMRTIPEETRSEFLYTIDWLKTRPCTRSSGLGTRFPFDEDKMIEALSDSTIYMAYYTISHMLDDLDPESMDEDFFDYIFLGKGEPADEHMRGMRESFLYWYPVDSRHSAGDLIRNHLVLYIFNHVGIFERNLWPRQIVTNGFVTMEGSKMSKSMGNILPIRKAISEYGADIVRFSLVSGSDLLHDGDFNRTVAEGVRNRVDHLDSLINNPGKEAPPESRADRWILSRLNRKITRARELYREVALRHLALEVFYDVFNDLNWYERRSDKSNLRGFFRKWVALISPFMPHFAEEWWSILGNDTFISLESFPAVDDHLIDDSIERGESLIRNVHDDIGNISRLIGKRPERIFIYVSGEWKRKAYEILRKVKSFDGFMKDASKDPVLRPHMKELTGMAKSLMKNIHSLPDTIPADEEYSSLKDAEGFFSGEFDCAVFVSPAGEGGHPKAKNALPGKPAIVIE